MKNKYLAFGLISLVALIAIGFSVYSQMNLTSKNNEISTLQSQNQAMSATATQQVFDHGKIEIESQNNIASLQTQNTDLQSKINGLENEIATKKASELCVNVPSKIDFSSNSTVSYSLKTWIENQESIDTAKWESVWNNGTPSIHKLTGQYLYVFVVFFNDSAMGTKNGVFDIRHQCWLAK